MTIRLLKPYAQRPVNAITTFPASVEAGLIAAGKATADLTGGVQYFAPRSGLVLQAKQIAVGTVTLQAEEQATVTLPEGQALLVSGAASTVGAVSRAGSTDTWAVAAGALAAIGPYAGPQRFSITCTTGAIIATVRDAVLTATGAAVATVTGTGIVGQPLTATLPAGVVGTLQFTKALKAAPFTKSNISGAVASAVNSLSYTVQSGDALYNIGCDASSTVSSSNVIAAQAAVTTPGQSATLRTFETFDVSGNNTNTFNRVAVAETGRTSLIIRSPASNTAQIALGYRDADNLNNPNPDFSAPVLINPGEEMYSDNDQMQYYARQNAATAVTGQYVEVERVINL